MTLTQEILKEYLRYNPDTGEFTRIKGRKDLIGTRAGSVTEQGYRIIYLLGQYQKEHRLAVLYMTGKFPLVWVDHINHKVDDNRWCNIREATKSENQYNTVRTKGNTGIKGIYYNNRYGRFECKIQARHNAIQKSFYIKDYLNIDETLKAAKKYLQSIREVLHYNFAHN
jgi:hypothetical protein